MCQGRDHGYRIHLTIQLRGGTQKEQDLHVRAKGIGPALCAADAWAQEHYPEADFVSFKSHRASYGSRASAEEHGADYSHVDATAKYLADLDARARTCSYEEALELQA
jgi:hypothetical protein